MRQDDLNLALEEMIRGTAQEALDQINEKGYARPYLTDGRKVVKAGVKFSTESKTLEDWKMEC